MKSLNLYALTRAQESKRFSLYEQALSGRTYRKNFNSHEIVSLRMLVEELMAEDSTAEKSPCGSLALSHFDGFYFSYTIDHISKEFDLLKVSQNKSCVLNIELKSEDIGEERVKAQLVQNRYYLGHITKRIHSFTYISDTRTLYSLSARGHLRKVPMSELASLMTGEFASGYLTGQIEELFSESDYMISPLHTPERFLAGEYFLTNQQAEFKRQVLEYLAEVDSYATATSGFHRTSVIGISGSSGTGKTLLLYDLVRELSRKKHVCLIHCGPLCDGHRILDERWKNVEIYSMLNLTEQMEAGVTDLSFLHDCDIAMIDEANHITPWFCEKLEASIAQNAKPSACFYSYNPDQALRMSQDMRLLDERIREIESLHCELSGNLRVNRSIASFIRELLHTTDAPRQKEYDCIDILYASGEEEQQILTAYGAALGFETLHLSADTLGIIGHEFDSVQVILGSQFHYNEKDYLCSSPDPTEVFLLSEVLSRARKRLRIIVSENPVLFDQILTLKSGSL